MDLLMLNYGLAVDAYFDRHRATCAHEACPSVRVHVCDDNTAASLACDDNAAASLVTVPENIEQLPSVSLKVWSCFLAQILDRDPATGLLKDLEIRSYPPPVRFMSTHSISVPVALTPCGTWSELDVIPDTDVTLLGVTYIVSCEKLHLDRLLQRGMMLRHRIPATCLIHLARTQPNDCLYAWTLRGSRRYTEEERVRIEESVAGKRRGPVIWTTLVPRAVDSIDVQ